MPATTAAGPVADPTQDQIDAEFSHIIRTNFSGQVTSYRGADGFQFETHWYENYRTGQVVELKTKITGGDP